MIYTVYLFPPYIFLQMFDLHSNMYNIMLVPVLLCKNKTSSPQKMFWLIS